MLVPVRGRSRKSLFCHQLGKAVTALSLLAMSTGAVAQSMVAVANGRTVGSLDVTTSNGETFIVFATSDNGRGATARERLSLDQRGFPIRWDIDATTLVGAPVKEHMARAGGRLTWTADADHGTTTTASLYFANNASPYALGIYARAALRQADHRIRVAPEGELSVDDVGEAPSLLGQINIGGRIYRLSGLWMTPVYVVLDRKLDLLATTAGGDTILIQKGLAAAAPALQERLHQLAVDRLEMLQARLAHRYDRPIAIYNVHVFDAHRRSIGPLQIVTVYRDRITGLTEDTPAERKRVIGDVTIDGDGGTIIPGLRDMHSHTSPESGLFNLAAGVTSTRDMGNDPNFLEWLRPQFDSGKLAGPRITPAGFVEGVSPYSSSIGFLAHDLGEAIGDIGWYATRGYWQLKIYNSIPAAWVKPMAAEAHRLGMGVTGHIPAFMTADQAIRDGYDEVAHINQLMFQWVLAPGEDTRTPLRLIGLKRFAGVDLNSERVTETLKLMRERRTVLDTTISTQERIALSRSGFSQRGELAYLANVPIAYQRYRKRDLVPITNAADDRDYHKAVDVMVALIGKLHAQGTRLMPGTDDPYGFPLHRELELYVLAGINPSEVLSIDVLKTAEYLGQSEQLGTIERGKLADLVLLPGDPTKDISQVRHARMVMRGGTVYFPDEIYTALAIKPFSSRPTVKDN